MVKLFTKGCKWYVVYSHTSGHGGILKMSDHRSVIEAQMFWGEDTEPANFESSLFQAIQELIQQQGYKQGGTTSIQVGVDGNIIERVVDI
jgi:hypothetical protein